MSEAEVWEKMPEREGRPILGTTHEPSLAFRVERIEKVLRGLLVLLPDDGRPYKSLLNDLAPSRTRRRTTRTDCEHDWVRLARPGVIVVPPERYCRLCGSREPLPPLPEEGQQ